MEWLHHEEKIGATVSRNKVGAIMCEAPPICIWSVELTNLTTTK